MKQKIHKLTTDAPYKLIGIVSYLSIHQICWLLNEELKILFHESQSIIAKKNNSEPNNFPVFICEFSENLIYVLYSNKAGANLFIKSNKQSNYLLKCSGDISQDEFLFLIKKIRELSNIATAFEIDISQLKKSEQSLLS